MLTQAIQKLQTEMEKEQNNPYVQVVGGFLQQHINMHPKCAENIMTEGKTIADSLNKMRKAAEKKKVGNCAVLTDQEGFAIVLKYFGIEGEQEQAVVYQEPAALERLPDTNTIPIFDITLDDLL